MSSHELYHARWFQAQSMAVCPGLFYFLTYMWPQILLSRKLGFSSFFGKAVVGLSLCA